MDKISLCNYCAMCDKNGVTVGHSDKVTKEYLQILKLAGYESVDLFAVKSIFEANISSVRVGKSLPYEIKIDDPFTLKRRVQDKIGLLKNISECIKSADGIIFFYQVDFFLFFYLWLFYRGNKDIYALIFHQNFTGGRLEPFLQHIYQKGLKKLKGVVYTQPGAMIPHPNTVWISDYSFSEEYNQYKVDLKEKRIVCLGAMNRYKQLEGMLEALANNTSLDGYEIEIVGVFDDKNRFGNLKNKVDEINEKSAINVILEDKLLSKSEYYEKIARAEFSFLPYDMNQYQNRTSGVLLETIFLETIPISPSKMLENNECAGIGYDDISAIRDIEFSKIDIANIKGKNQPRIDNCRMERTAKIMADFFK